MIRGIVQHFGSVKTDPYAYYYSSFIINYSLFIKNICRGRRPRRPTSKNSLNVGAGLDQPRKKRPRWDSFVSNGSVLNKDRNGGNINGEKTK